MGLHPSLEGRGRGRVSYCKVVVGFVGPEPGFAHHASRITIWDLGPTPGSWVLGLGTPRLSVAGGRLGGGEYYNVERGAWNPKLQFLVRKLL